jgi:GrpB-like predicted nucleotidyltransferase (UPF0157 family)
VVVDDLISAGLGLDYGTLRLERTTEAWLVAGLQLRDEVGESLGQLVVAIEQIGSSSVPGLMAKPIIDLAAGFEARPNLEEIVGRMLFDGWIYRGDAGDNGGHVFVLEDRPWHRIAHLHLVDHRGAQWRNYLRFRELLRDSSLARERYETTKLQLANQYGGDVKSYTDGKTDVVRALLAECSDDM